MLTPHNPFSFQYALKKDKLNGSNFLQWYRNPRIVLKQEFKPYLEDLKRKKTFETSSKGIYVIEVNVTTSGSTSWVLDTGCGAHICTNMNGLSNSRILEKGQVDLRAWFEIAGGDKKRGGGSLAPSVMAVQSERFVYLQQNKVTCKTIFLYIY